MRFHTPRVGLDLDLVHCRGHRPVAPVGQVAARAAAALLRRLQLLHALFQIRTRSAPRRRLALALAAPAALRLRFPATALPPLPATLLAAAPEFHLLQLAVVGPQPLDLLVLRRQPLRLPLQLPPRGRQLPLQFADPLRRALREHALQLGA